jgi:hypothetical protein
VATVKYIEREYPDEHILYNCNGLLQWKRQMLAKQRQDEIRAAAKAGAQ